MTSDEIKERYSMVELASRYGLQATRKGYICCPYHCPREKTPSMKLYGNNYHCYGCDADGDIFHFIMHMENMTFHEAFIFLGGAYSNKFSDRRKAELSTKAMESRKQQAKKEIAERQLNNRLIGIYRKGTEIYEPFSDEWCYCKNKLMYQLYVSEVRASEHRNNDS